MKVSVILPTKNEEEAIGIILKRCKEALKNIDHELVVVDNSTDRTPEIAEEFGSKVIRNVEGYGRAYIEGLKVAEGDVVVMLDADGTYDPLEIPKLIEPIISNEADIVLGSRFLGEIRQGAMNPIHKLGNILLTKMTNFFFKTSLTDVHSGMRAAKKRIIDSLKLSCEGMEFATEMLAKAWRMGMKIIEVPITYHPRKGDSKLRTFRDGWRHLRLMLLLSPTHLFLIPATLMLLAGVALILYVLLFEPIRTHTLVLASMLTMIGAQTFFFGVSSKIYSSKIGLTDEDKFVRFFKRYSILEEGLLLGISLIVAGLILGYAILSAWIGTGYGELNALNYAILSFLMVAVGLQVAFSTFFISSLWME
ncbi:MULTISPECIES: glycosyltransferase family 2 protein [unclassified Archaeoglobus]|uniref:glycosyltransferase family 2 protein n=1 Tax=unclassified Archaeoglobus TaxID=2643606 RepID=UPI0025BBEC18|nr:MULTISPECIES: glycosyltransferase family 2 protein [unclassified Archaeoglobus]